MRKAFTMIELIIVIVILGIVAYIASGLIAQTFLAYNYTKTTTRSNMKVENALTLIGNRLEYALPNTIVKRKSATDNSIAPINTAPADYEVLEWVGYDGDGFGATEYENNGTSFDYNPAWSGFCDIKNSNNQDILTPGSNLRLANTILKRLTQAKYGNKGLAGSAIFFPGNYDYYDIGYSNTSGYNSDKIAVIYNYTSRPSERHLALNSQIKRITEVYKLAWSAYAVVPTNCTTDTNNVRSCDLELRYNFRPWLNTAGNIIEEYNILGGSHKAYHSTIINNVTVFKTYATQNRVHIKLCVRENYDIGNKKASICKEKVVFRWWINKEEHSLCL